MPGKKMDLKKIKTIGAGKNKPNIKVGKGMRKSGKIKGRKMGGKVQWQHQTQEILIQMSENSSKRHMKDVAQR